MATSERLRIALLEDDPVQAESLGAWLAAAGHTIHAYGRAGDLLRAAGRESFDLYVADWMLPDGSGFDVLRWLRQERQDTSPLLFVTSRDAEEDIVAALREGADDYLVKPVRRQELLARLEAVWRRARPREEAGDVLEVPPYRFELASRRLLVAGQPVEDLTDKEFQLAAFLFRNLGRLLSRGHLLEAVWGIKASVPTRTLDTHISRVRRKLDISPAKGYRLAPIYNFGYRLEEVTR